MSPGPHETDQPPPGAIPIGRLAQIGLYGGSFDPVHLGHLHVARAALAAFDLDGIVFVPAAEPPHKPGQVLASGADRLAMLELAIAGEPRFKTSDLELRRGGRSFTIDTVRALPVHLGALGAQLFLILGSDNLPDFPHWREARALLDLAQPIVVHRGGEPDRLLADLGRELGPEAERTFARGYLRLPPVEVSSTELRARLPGAEVSLEQVPPAVRRYIEAHGLYGARR